MSTYFMYDYFMEYNILIGNETNNKKKKKNVVDPFNIISILKNVFLRYKYNSTRCQWENCQLHP